MSAVLVGFLLHVSSAGGLCALNTDVSLLLLGRAGAVVALRRDRLGRRVQHCWPSGVSSADAGERSGFSSLGKERQ